MTRYAKTMSDAFREVQEATLNVKSKYSKDNKVSKKELQSMENDNEHGEVALALAQSFGTPREVTKVRYINKMHKARGEIIQSDQKERDAIIRKYYKMAEEVEIQEDGHADVASAIRQCKTVTEDAMQIQQKLQTMSPEDSLPTWWSNKLAIASNSMNKMRDYLLVPSVSEETELDEALKHTHMVLGPDGRVIGMSSNERGANDIAKNNLLKVKGRVVKLRKPMSSTRGDRLIGMLPADNLGEETLYEQPEHEIQVGDYTTKHFHMCGSAQKVMKKHADKDGAEELAKLQDKFYEIEMMAMNAGKPTDEQISQTKTLYNQIMSKAKEMGIDDEVGEYMKMHMDSMEKGDPKLGFGRTDKDDGKEPIDETVLDTVLSISKGGSRYKDQEKDKDGKFIVKDRLGKVITSLSPSGAKKFLDSLKDPISGKGSVDALKKDRERRASGDSGGMGVRTRGTPEKNIVNLLRKFKEEVDLDEKYDLYHSTFSGAMQHAYDYAKKKLGITVDPKEIDNKVATGPKKPSEGKTNKYRLKGKGGNLQIQVYNKGGSKPFELNMYKEETELDEMIPKSTMYALVKDGKVVAKGSKSDMMSKMKKEGGKVFNAPSKKVGDTIKEENEMNEKNKLKPGVKFDFRLFDPEDSPGSDKANDDMNKEIQKAVRMKDKETARQHMMKVQKKHSKHGATDTEPREVINQILDAIYEARERFNEKFSITLPPTRGGKKLLNIDMGRAIRMLKDFGATKSDIRHALSGKGGRFQNAGGEMFLVQREGVELGEGYESEVKKVLDKEGIDGYFKNGKLYVSKRDAKDAKKALEDSDEITKLPPMVKEENDMTKNLKETIMDMWKEAVSPAQQAAIAISKKEKEKEEGNAFTGALKAAKEKGEKTFTVAGKEYDVKTEKLVGGQKKLDKDNDGDIDGKDFAMLRKQKKNEELEQERQRYLETKKGSVRESILKMWGEISEKVEYVEYDFKNKNDAMKAKKMLDGMKMMSFDINDDGISRGMLTVDAGNRDMTKAHQEIMKMFKPRIVAQEKKDLTKNEKDDSVKMTDTGKEMTPVDMSPKMPKVKESKNKV